MALSNEGCRDQERGENLSGEAWVRRSPVINEFLQKAVTIYMACHQPGEDISFSDQDHVFLSNFLSKVNNCFGLELQRRSSNYGLRPFLVPSPCPPPKAKAGCHHL